MNEGEPTKSPLENQPNVAQTSTETQYDPEKIRKDFSMFLSNEQDKGVNLLVENLNKNRLVFNLVLSEIKKNIDAVKNLPSDKKKIIVSMLIGYIKEDAENSHINLDSDVKDIIYLLLGGKEVSDVKVEVRQKKQVHTFVKGFWLDVHSISNIFLQKIENPISSEVDISSLTYDKDFVDKIDEYLEKNLKENLNTISDPNLKEEYKRWAENVVLEIKDLFENPDKNVSGKHRKFHKLSLDQDKFIDKLSREYLSSKAEYENILRDRDAVYKSILSDETVSQEMVDNKIKFFRVALKEKEDWSKDYVEKNELKDDVKAIIYMFQKFFNEAKVIPDLELGKFASTFLHSIANIPEIKSNPQYKHIYDLYTSLEKIIPNIGIVDISQPLELSRDNLRLPGLLKWSDLEGLDQSKLKELVTHDDGIHVYNEMFDVMYKSKLQPGTYDFLGKTIEITDKHVETFKNMIIAKYPQFTPENLDSLELIYNSKTADNNYPEGMRLVKISYMEGVVPKTTYFVPGEYFEAYELADGLKQRLQDPLQKDKISVENLLSQLDILSQYGGPEALRTLFSLKSKEVVSYFEQEGKLKQFIDTVFSLDNVEIRRSYLLQALVITKSNQDLYQRYMENFNTNMSKLDGDLLTKQIILDNFSQDLLNNGSLLSSADPKLVTDVITSNLAIDAQTLEDQPKSLEGQIQALVKQGVGILFAHPIGRMLMSFLDSVFGGKGGLKDMFGRIPGFNEELDREFQKQYGLEPEQLGILSGLTEKNFKNPDLSKEESGKEMDLLRENMLNNGHYDTLSKSFFDDGGKLKTVKNSDSSPYVLDAGFLSNYYLNYNKKGEMGTSYESLFTVDATTKEVSFKEGVNKDILSPLLLQMMQDPSTHKAIYEANDLMRGNKNSRLSKKINIDAPENIGIRTQVDYAKALAAYLMGGSKGEGKFHYILSENDIGSLPKAAPKTPENINQNPSDSEKDPFIPAIDAIIAQTGDGEKFQGYEFKKSVAPYTYESEDKLVSPKKEYQTKFLQPLAELFAIEESQGKLSNFTRLLSDSRNKSGNISENPIFKDANHISNMMTFMNAGETDPAKLTFSSDVIVAMKNMTKIQVSDGVLVFSADDGSTIELSLTSEKKLEAKYTPKVIANDPVVAKAA